MNELFLSAVIFAVCFFVHIFLHRLLKIFHTKSFLVIFVYGVGLIINAHAVGSVTSIIFFVLLSILMMVIYLPVTIAGAQTPAAIILTAFAKKSKQKKSALLKLFSQKLLIEKRIEDLQKVGLVTQRKGIFTVTRRGKIISFFIIFAIQFLGISVGG